MLLCIIGMTEQESITSSIKLNQSLTPPSRPVIALSAKWHTCPDRINWITEHGFSLEYSPDPAQLGLVSKQLRPYLDAGLLIRHHAFFPGYEIGHGDREKRKRAMQVHLSALDTIRNLGEPFITIHIGLDVNDDIDFAAAVDNLARLADYGRAKGVTVCLENLRRGPASNPELLLRWAEESGAMITFDIGHAVSSRRVVNGEITTVEFLDSISDRVVEAHVYEKETDRHHPPEDISVLGPVIDRLLLTACTWWTIELDDCEEALSTRRLLLDYLGTKPDMRYTEQERGAK